MSAPFLWIFLPLILAGLLLFLNNQKVIFVVACLFTLFLSIAAWLLPVDTALTIGGLTFKLAPSFEILGRNLTLTSANRSFLALIYGSAFFWFVPTASLQIARRLIPLGLAITSLLVAALAVEPFLYAALIIEVAVLLSIPLLTSPGQKPGKGIIRYLIFQTLIHSFLRLAAHRYWSQSRQSRQCTTGSHFSWPGFCVPAGHFSFLHLDPPVGRGGSSLFGGLSSMDASHSHAVLRAWIPGQL